MCTNPNCSNDVKPGNKYCTRSCHMQHRNSSKKNGVIVKCKVCASDMYVAKWELETKKYCSPKCRHEGHKVLRVPITCSLEGCSSVFHRTEKEAEKKEKKYCSRKCASIAGRLAAQESGKIKDTKPELEFKEWCDERGIDYVHQYALPWKKGWKKWYDFYLPKLNLLVEIDGTYWHGKGLKYEELNEQQRNTRSNDLLKNKLASLEGYNLIRIWSDEIHKFKTKEQLIQK